MTLKEAVRILNEHKHRGTEGYDEEWLISGVQVMGPEPVRVVSIKTRDNLTAFEAIAIAEKYARGDTPESIMEQVAREIEIYDE